MVTHVSGLAKYVNNAQAYIRRVHDIKHSARSQRAVRTKPRAREALATREPRDAIRARDVERAAGRMIIIIIIIMMIIIVVVIRCSIIITLLHLIQRNIT